MPTPMTAGQLFYQLDQELHTVPNGFRDAMPPSNLVVVMDPNHPETERYAVAVRYDRAAEYFVIEFDSTS